MATNLPPKNLPRLLEAVASIASAERPTLVLVGHCTDDVEMQSAVASLGSAEHVRLLGRCSPPDLEALYALAAAVVLAALHEGFGLPVIEALARSAPVLCSDIPVLREVGDAAALYFDPTSRRRLRAGSASC